MNDYKPFTLLWWFHIYKMCLSEIKSYRILAEGADENFELEKCSRFTKKSEYYRELLHWIEKRLEKKYENRQKTR